MIYKSFIGYAYELDSVVRNHIMDGWAVFMIHETNEARLVVTFIKNVPDTTKP